MVKPLIRGRTDGVYECIASNGHRSIRKGVKISIVDETAEGFPEIHIHPAHVGTFRNQVDFHCVVSGAPEMKIVWFHNRVPLPQSPAYNVSPTALGRGKFYSNLMIMNVTKETKESYQCIAINSIGQAVSRQGNIEFSGERMRLRKKYRYRREVIDHNKCSFLQHEEDVLTSWSNLMLGTTITVSATCVDFQRSFGQRIRWDDHNLHSELDDYCLVVRHENMTRYHSANGERKYTFEQEAGLLYDVIVVAISRSKQVLSKGSVKTSQCPGDVKVSPLPNTVVSEGEDFNFTVSYTGGPVKDIRWYFSTDLAHCKDRIVLNDCTGSEFCRINNLSKKNEGCYTARVEAQSTVEGVGFIHLVKPPPEVKDRNIILPALGGIIGSLLLIASIVLLRNKFLPSPLPHIPPVSASPVSSVYISHCCKSEDQRRRLLKFAHILQARYGIEVVLDLTSVVEVDKAGGMCQWLPQAMKRADRMVVVLTKSYVATLGGAGDDTDVCKVSY